MASSFCWSCLSKLRPTPKALLPSAPLPRAVAAAPFHSSAPAYVLPPKKSKSQDSGPKFREARSARIKKKNNFVRPQRESPADRKAHAQRLVLSNTNALEVPSLKDFSVETMVDEKLHGKVLGIPMALIDSLRDLQAFKLTQGWGLFRRPATLMRQETLDLGKLMMEIREQEKKKAVAQIITGDRYAGKSVHLLQAMTIGLLNNWVILSIPDGKICPRRKRRLDRKLTRIQPGISSMELPHIPLCRTQILSNTCRKMQRHNCSSEQPRSMATYFQNFTFPENILG